MPDMNKVLYNIDQRNDTTDAQKTMARDNIGAVSSSDVSSAISNAINALDVTDTAVANQFVTAVSEANGKINVSRAQPAIADVSGLQDALDNIPRPKNGVLTIQKNGTQVATFSADQSSNATANITVPTKTSELTNDSGFITEAGVPKEIEYVTTASTFDEIKAIVKAGHEPVLKVESSGGGVSYKLRLPLVYFETGTMSAQVARFSGTNGDKIYTYTLMAGSWSTETTTVPDSLGAGNGIYFDNNAITVKPKAGGGLDVGADGVYVTAHYVSYDANQGLSQANQGNARANINSVEACGTLDIDSMKNNQSEPFPYRAIRTLLKLDSDYVRKDKLYNKVKYLNLLYPLLCITHREVWRQHGNVSTPAYFISIIDLYGNISAKVGSVVQIVFYEAESSEFLIKNNSGIYAGIPNFGSNTNDYDYHCAIIGSCGNKELDSFIFEPTLKLEYAHGSGSNRSTTITVNRADLLNTWIPDDSYVAGTVSGTLKSGGTVTPVFYHFIKSFPSGTLRQELITDALPVPNLGDGFCVDVNLQILFKGSYVYFTFRFNSFIYNGGWLEFWTGSRADSTASWWSTPPWNVSTNQN